ncbi:MAG: DUF4062 domain-containing protein [Planctomycetota bacterium]|nr:DUF4062 domain-containing protein [Planctomycetota bacterium]
MISSTALDLPDHRAQAMNACLRAGMQPLVMEAMPGSDKNAVAESLRLVDEADIYVGILAYRYGHVPEDGEKSITHLEYERALERKISVLFFLIHKDHPIKIDDVEYGPGADMLRLLKKEIDEVKVAPRFKGPEDLRGHILHALTDQKALIQGDDKPSAQSFHHVSAIPGPPEPYVAHPYTLLQTRDLVGRRAELAHLTDWVTLPEHKDTRIMSLVAIGGMGKSALCWKWFRDIAPQELPDLDGRLWWSFYESDASYEAFVTRGLAYVTRKAEDDVRKYPLDKREAALLHALDRGRYLVVLDGLERLLIAYAGMDAAYLGDDDLDEETANRVAGSIGLPAGAGETFAGRHRLRKTADIRAGRFLDRLRQVRGSRVLVSTRLYPAELQTAAGGSLPGCAALIVKGLSEGDALELWRTFGARGSSEAMGPYFRKVDNHPLLIQVLASEVAHDRKARGNFDAWSAARPGFDPFTLPLVKARTHIMEHALTGLDDVQRRTLHVIAGFRMPCSLDTLTALLVDDGEEHEEGEGPARPLQTLAALDTTLTVLEDRGLVGWDRNSNRYDLHPIVRGVVWAGLEEGRRTEVYDVLESHFRAIPAIEEDEVVQLGDLTPSIELYNILIARARFDDAWVLFHERISVATHFRLGAAREQIEMLGQLFPDGVDQPPRLSSTRARSWTLNTLAMSYDFSGRPGAALDLYRRSVAIHEREGDLSNLRVDLSNLSNALYRAGQIHESESSARRGLGLCREEKNRIHEGVSLYIAGLTLALRGANAEAAFERSLRIWVAVGRRQSGGIVSSFFAELEVWREDASAAARHADRAWQAAGITRQEADFIRAARLQGTAAFLAGDLDRATERLEHAIARARAIDLYEESLPALVARAEVARACDERTRARDLLSDVWEAAERGPYPTYNSDAGVVLARIERDAGDRDAAAAAATRAFELAWCDGPPYAYHWGVEKARALLTELDAPIPEMPPFDPTKHEPMPDIEVDPPDDPIEADEG